MTRQVTMRTSFASGELDPALLGRVDLRAQEDGASLLRNVIVQPTGGVARRAGTRIINEMVGAERLIPFEDASGPRLAVLGPARLLLVRDGAIEADLASIWTATQLGDIDWTRYGDSLLICHPDVAPQRLARNVDGIWLLHAWTYDTRSDAPGQTHYLAPFAKIAPADATLRAYKDGAGSNYAPKAGDMVILEAGSPVFGALHYGSIIAIKDRQVEVTGYLDSSRLQARVLEDLIDDEATLRWQEEVFSRARGYPRSVTFHQDRLIVGGSRDLPDWVWMSSTGRPFDFDPGTGLDDEAIVFRISADGHHEITKVFPGRQLQVFSTFGEWTVKGFPLTPTSIEVMAQTSVGSPPVHRVRPIDVDGATLFIGAGRRQLREFLYTDTEQAYQAADIATLSRHLLQEPVDMVFDGHGRQLWIVLGNGGVATVTIDRNANVTAWSLQEFTGSVKAVATIRGAIYLLVEVGSSRFLEMLDSRVALDHALLRHGGPPTTVWDELDLLVGRPVVVMVDGIVLADDTLASGTIVTPPGTNWRWAPGSSIASSPYRRPSRPRALRSTTPIGLLEPLFASWGPPGLRSTWAPALAPFLWKPTRMDRRTPASAHMAGAVAYRPGPGESRTMLPLPLHFLPCKPTSR